MKRNSGQLNQRRIGALDRLQKQLEKGTRPITGIEWALGVGGSAEKLTWDEFMATPAQDRVIPLTEKDVKRINAEIQVLKSRITTNILAA